MKKYQSFGFLASIVFAVGMVGFSLSDDTFGTAQEDLSSMGGGLGLVGHIEAIHTDSEGNIIGYVQTDNAITNQGINCTLAKMFGTGYADNTICLGDVGTYEFIGLANSTLAANGLNANVTSGLYEGATATANGLLPKDGGTPTWNSVATGAGAGQTDRTTNAEVLITAQFTSVGDTHAVNGATLQNSTSNLGIFAFKDFGTSLNLNDQDSLTVNWQIGMTGTFDPTT
jgi:hypothetical protein